MSRMLMGIGIRMSEYYPNYLHLENQANRRAACRTPLFNLSIWVTSLDLNFLPISPLYKHQMHNPWQIKMFTLKPHNSRPQKKKKEKTLSSTWIRSVWEFIEEDLILQLWIWDEKVLREWMKGKSQNPSFIWLYKRRVKWTFDNFK